MPKLCFSDIVNKPVCNTRDPFLP